MAVSSWLGQRSEIRSFLSNSILQRQSENDIPKFNWVYNRMLQMRFLRPNILDIFRKLENFDASLYTFDGLLNYFIDLYYNQFPADLVAAASQNRNRFPSDDIHVSHEDSFLQIRKKLEKHTLSQNANSLPLPITLIEEAIPQGKDCPICLCPIEDASMKKILPNCEHFFCEECLLNYLKHEITTGKVITIKCPLEGCTIPLAKEYCEGLLNEKNPILLEKYRKFMLDYEVLLDPRKKWCIRPNCTTWLFKDQATESNRMECPTCGQEFCFHCNSAWHENKTCDEAIDEDYQKYEAEVIVKHCPKCNWKIEKNEGCNHMHCRCGHHFCWLCLGDYRNGYCVNKCPKFPNMQNENPLAHQILLLEEMEWEVRLMRFEDSRWAWFDDMNSNAGKVKYFLAFFLSFMTFPFILFAIFYGTIFFGILCEPFMKMWRMMRGFDEYPIEVEFSCNSFENICYIVAFFPFFLFMNLVLVLVYILSQLFFFIEKHVYTNFLKYFIMLERTNNVFSVFRHLIVLTMRNSPTTLGNNEDEASQMRVLRMLAAVTFFFIFAIHLLVALIIMKYTV